MLESAEEGLADLGARLELCFVELRKLCRLWSHGKDRVGAVDSDYLVSADGW